MRNTLSGVTNERWPNIFILGPTQ